MSSGGVEGNWLPLYGCDQEVHVTLRTLLFVEFVDVWRVTELATIMVYVVFQTLSVQFYSVKGLYPLPLPYLCVCVCVCECVYVCVCVCVFV